MNLAPTSLEKIKLLKEGKLSCEENAKTFLAEAEKRNEEYNIVLEFNEKALDRARELDKKREEGQELGSLFGMCFFIKSNISMIDMTVSCASKTLENYKGSFNADVVNNLLEQDAIILGMANNDEFACGSSGEHSAFGPTINPKAPSRVPGGTSSGSAAAVAANMCDVALGTDTGGSCRNPASHCGTVGIKPSYGRVSRYGIVDSAMSFDQVGIMCQDLDVSALTLEVISGYSTSDPTSKDEPVQEYHTVSKKDKYKVGFVQDFYDMIEDERIKALFDKKLEEIKAQGHEIVELDFENIDLAVQSYYPIQYTEFSSGMRKFDGVKYGKHVEDTAQEEVLRRLYGGREISKAEFDGAYYKKALRVREKLSQEFIDAFGKVDFILTPVTPNLPHKLGSVGSAEEEYAIDAFTVPPSLTGICAGVLSKDIIEQDGEEVPVGIQVLANFFAESQMVEGLKLLDSL